MTVTVYTEVEFCNIALTMIGGGTVNTIDIDEIESDVEGHCARLYPLVVDSLLSKYQWSFCTPERVLAQNADTVPLEGLKYAHKLPSDLIAGPFAVWGDGSRTPVSWWINANGFIHSNYQMIKIQYRKSVSVNLFPAYFVNVGVADLASCLAKPVADNTALGDQMWERAYGPRQLGGMGGLFAVAKSIDAQSKPMKSLFGNGNFLSSTRR